MADINKKVGRQLRKHRRLMNFSQGDVAKKLNLESTAIISRWERGVTRPSLDSALKLSALYKTLVNQLFWDLFAEYRKKLHTSDEKFTGNDP